MNLIVKQDIIEFYEILDKARDKINELIESRKYKYSEPLFEAVQDRISLTRSSFIGSILHLISYAEFTEIMNSIEKVGEE